MKQIAVVISGAGKQRENNQDNFLLRGVCRDDFDSPDVVRVSGLGRGEGLYAVADGIGGMDKGERASYAVVKKLKWNRCRNVQAVQQCSSAVEKLAQENGKPMGSTLVAVKIRGKQAQIYNVGDSRAYLWRGGALSQLSRDHTSSALLVEMGYISKDEARARPDGHRLTQYLGMDSEEMLIQPHVVQMELQHGDLILLCSDGLTDMMTDEEIAAVLTGQQDPERAAVQLYDGAMERGGIDNTTIMLIRTEERRI